MTLLQALILGLVQGSTEFLPISSSGHLGLVTHLMRVDDSGLVFEVIVHFGTLLSVIVYFHRRLLALTRSLWTPGMKEERRLILWLILGTVPAAVIGLTFKDFFEGVNENPVAISLLLLVTGTLLLLPKWLKRRDGQATLRLPSALAMGFGQALAILPGISRSGSTIVAGMLAGTRPAVAAEFSFLLSIPAIGGAAVLLLQDLEKLERSLLGVYLAGGLVAFLSGLAAVYTVLASIRRGKFEYFAYYCYAVGAAAFVYFQFFHDR